MNSPTKAWYGSPEMLVGLSAVLVSVVALGVGIYSAYIDRTSARASVWPSLMLARSYSSERFQFVVLNQGTGPAIVKYARVQQGGQYVKDWRSLVGLLGLEESSYAQSHIGGGVIRPAQQIVAFTTKDQALHERLLSGSEVSVEICYCSVFEQCWVADSIESPREVPICEVNKSQRFEQ